MVTKAERKRIREVQRLAEKAEPLREFGEGGPGRGHKEHGTKQPRPTGMTKAYLVGRIARDHPDILERMKVGEFVTVRQAAVAAGIRKNPTHLDQFEKLWRNASDEEREAIAVDVMGWLLGQDPEVRDLAYEKAAKLSSDDGSLAKRRASDREQS